MLRIERLPDKYMLPGPNGTEKEVSEEEFVKHMAGRHNCSEDCVREHMKEGRLPNEHRKTTQNPK